MLNLSEEMLQNLFSFSFLNTEMNQVIETPQFTHGGQKWGVFCECKFRYTLWGHLNIKMPSPSYKDLHVKDKTVSWPSYL